MIQLRDLNLDKGIRQKASKEKTWHWLREMGLCDGNVIANRNYGGVDGVWKDQPAYVVGASPSLRETLRMVGGWEFFRGKHTIGINHTIEDFDGFEWFFFLDARFLNRTTYNMANYKGTVFAQCTTGMKPAEKVKIFYGSENPSGRLKDGLYGRLSGVAALNLAIITGANPIYLFGLDPGAKPISNDNLHYKDDYNGEKSRVDIAARMTRVLRAFDVYKPYAARLRLVTDGGNWYPWMKRATVEELTGGKAAAVSVEAKEARIVHISFSDDLARHADVTRHTVAECIGQHSMYSTRSGAPLPPADLYVAEHFLSTNEYVNGLPDEVKRKTIDIVHTVGCLPKGPFRKVLALTDAWKVWLEKHLVKVDRVWRPGIDLEPYKNVTPDYAGKVFGRMTRWNAEKIHPEWNQATLDILDAVPGSRCLMYVVVKDREQDGTRTFLDDNRVTYDQSCKIDQFKGDYLKKMSVYVHANGSFKETLSFAVIEAMATGLPVIYLSEGTGVIEEVVGEGGIACQTMDEVKAKVIEYLTTMQDPNIAEPIGACARQSAERFDKNRMVSEFNAIIEEELRRGR